MEDNQEHSQEVIFQPGQFDFLQDQIRNNLQRYEEEREDIESEDDVEPEIPACSFRDPDFGHLSSGRGFAGVKPKGPASRRYDTAEPIRDEGSIFEQSHSGSPSLQPVQENPYENVITVQNEQPEEISHLVQSQQSVQNSSEDLPVRPGDRARTTDVPTPPNAFNKFIDQSLPINSSDRSVPNNSSGASGPGEGSVNSRHSTKGPGAPASSGPQSSDLRQMNPSFATNIDMEGNLKIQDQCMGRSPDDMITALSPPSPKGPTHTQGSSIHLVEKLQSSDRARIHEAKPYQGGDSSDNTLPASAAGDLHGGGLGGLSTNEDQSALTSNTGTAPGTGPQGLFQSKISESDQPTEWIGNKDVSRKSEFGRSEGNSLPYSKQPSGSFKIAISSLPSQQATESGRERKSSYKSMQTGKSNRTSHHTSHQTSHRASHPVSHQLSNKTSELPGQDQGSRPSKRISTLPSGKTTDPPSSKPSVAPSKKPKSNKKISTNQSLDLNSNSQRPSGTSKLPNSQTSKSLGKSASLQQATSQKPSVKSGLPVSRPSIMSPSQTYNQPSSDSPSQPLSKRSQQVQADISNSDPPSQGPRTEPSKAPSQSTGQAQSQARSQATGQAIGQVSSEAPGHAPSHVASHSHSHRQNQVPSQKVPSNSRSKAQSHVPSKAPSKTTSNKTHLLPSKEISNKTSARVSRRDEVSVSALRTFEPESHLPSPENQKHDSTEYMVMDPSVDVSIDEQDAQLQQQQQQVDSDSKYETNRNFMPSRDQIINVTDGSVEHHHNSSSSEVGPSLGTIGSGLQNRHVSIQGKKQEVRLSVSQRPQPGTQSGPEEDSSFYSNIFTDKKNSKTTTLQIGSQSKHGTPIQIGSEEDNSIPEAGQKPKPKEKLPVNKISKPSERPGPLKKPKPIPGLKPRIEKIKGLAPAHDPKQRDTPNPAIAAVADFTGGKKPNLLGPASRKPFNPQASKKTKQVVKAYRQSSKEIPRLIDRWWQNQNQEASEKQISGRDPSRSLSKTNSTAKKTGFVPQPSKLSSLSPNKGNATLPKRISPARTTSPYNRKSRASSRKRSPDKFDITTAEQHLKSLEKNYLRNDGIQRSIYLNLETLKFQLDHQKLLDVKKKQVEQRFKPRPPSISPSAKLSRRSRQGKGPLLDTPSLQAQYSSALEAKRTMRALHSLDKQHQLSNKLLQDSQDHIDQILRSGSQQSLATPAKEPSPPVKLKSPYYSKMLPMRPKLAPLTNSVQELPSQLKAGNTIFRKNNPLTTSALALTKPIRTSFQNRSKVQTAEPVAQPRPTQPSRLAVQEERMNRSFEAVPKSRNAGLSKQGGATFITMQPRHTEQYGPETSFSPRRYRIAREQSRLLKSYDTSNSRAPIPSWNKIISTRAPPSQGSADSLPSIKRKEMRIITKENQKFFSNRPLPRAEHLSPRKVGVSEIEAKLSGISRVQRFSNELQRKVIFMQRRIPTVSEYKKQL